MTGRDVHCSGRFGTFLSLTAAVLVVAQVVAFAHDEDRKLPPTKAKSQLLKARAEMDRAKKLLAQQGKYACCVKPAPGSSSFGCDLCAKEHGSCNCGASLAKGAGVCGDCLAGWKSGRGAFANIKAESVTLLHSGHQAMPGVDASPDTPELKQARETLNGAKRVLVQETRYSCCVGQGGCDECAYEASCPCAKELAKGQKGKGICGQCYDGQHAGHGRIQGTDLADVKLSPMQHGPEGMEMMAGVAGIPMQRDASGTSWQPDSSPMHMHDTPLGRWMLMTHYNAFVSYDHQDGPRGDDQVNSVNWLMVMAQRPIGKGELSLRGMFSLEPATVGPSGYPLLLQSGEAYGGKPLVNRQHPHDFFMELAGRYRRPLGANTALMLYFAPVGEPALGPPAFPHRLSAMDLPMAPISHHWMDSTHITFGVATAGVSNRNWQLEGSVFTGREPDEHRWDFDPMRFDSYSGRLTYNPGRNWSVQGSYGYLKSPEQLRPDDDLNRTTVSVMNTEPRADGGWWGTTLAFGRNHSHGEDSDAWLLESSLNVARRNTLFGRVEHVRKLGDDLDFAPADAKLGLTELTLGGLHELTPNRSYETGVGAAVTINWTPAALEPLYGKNPVGVWVFLRIRPASMGHMQHEH